MKSSKNKKAIGAGRYLTRLAQLVAAIALLGLIPIPSAGAAPCLNEDVRKAQTSESLPSGTTTFPVCMALEMVTPPKKFGQETFRFSAFSVDGSRALYVSKAALADTEGLQSFGGDSYIAERGPGGWINSAVSPPASAELTGGGLAGGGPFAFGPTLDSWLLFGGTQEQRMAGKARYFAAGFDQGFSPFSPLLAPIDDSLNGVVIEYLIGTSFPFVATAEDLSATVFRGQFASTSYLPEDPRGNLLPNTYVAFRDALGEPTLQLLARDQAGKVWGGRCGASLGGGGGLYQGAISPDGSRFFFTTRPAQPFDAAKVGYPEENAPCSTFNPLRVMVRSGEGPQIEELVPGGASEPGNDLFQAASRDGSKVLLMSPRSLASSDQDATAEGCSSTVGASKGCDLYLYDADLPEGSRLIQVSAGEDVPGKHEAGKGADVLSSIAAASADGSHVYFAAPGVLTSDTNPEGKAPVAGKPNLYLYVRDAVHPDGQMSFIGTMSEADNGRVWANLPLAEGSPYPVPLLDGPEGGDGHILLFTSKASLVADDQDAGKADAYRYDSSEESLACVSCAPGGPDSQPFEVYAGSSQLSTGSNFAELGRWASEDGQTIAFVTAAALSPEDEDTEANSYLWREGQLQRLPGKIAEPISYFKLPLVSPEGQEVGFTTSKALLPNDGDSTRDAYVARVDGGFPNPVAAIPCDPLSEGACQGPPSSAPPIQAPATPGFSGPGNPAQTACKKSQVKKRGRCVPRKQKPRKHKRANGKKGGSK
jgi:hypothetical protein